MAQYAELLFTVQNTYMALKIDTSLHKLLPN